MSTYEINLLLPPTPRYILDQYAYDVFKETVGKLTYAEDPTLIDKLVDMCWLRFRNRPIGDYEYTYWVLTLDDKVRELWYGYEKTIGALMGNDLTGTSSSKTTDAGTISRVKTDKTTNDLITATEGQNTRAETLTASGTHKVESENNPDTEAGTTKYLSNRTTTTPGTINDNDITEDVTGNVTNTGTVDVEGTETETRDLTLTNESGLKAVNVLAMNEAVNKCVTAFVRDLEPIFMNRW